ncbi:MAG: hypothetical protein H6686_02860 [Fibrobacteria bacterium]|nr:hypothetical protein [Fibrobacteria bacterium]
MLPTPASPWLSSPTPSRRMVRHSKALLSLLVCGWISSCQSTGTAPDPEPGDSGRPLAAQILTKASAVPDSVILSRGSSKSAHRLEPVSTSYSNGRLVFRLVLPPDLSPDTLWTTWWVGGIPSRKMGFAFLDGKPALVADLPNPLMALLLERLDTLSGARTTEPGRRQDLLKLLGTGILQGDAAFANWTEKLPTGLTETQADSATLVLLARSGTSLEVAMRTWLSKRTREEALSILEDLRDNGSISQNQIDVVAKLETKPVRDTVAPDLRILSPVAGTDLPNDSTSILVEVSASDASGIESVKIGATLLKNAPWKARSDLAVGSNEIVVVALDSAGNTDTARVKVVRAARGDHTPPTIERLAPTSADTMVPWKTQSLLARWKIRDDSLLERVTFQGVALTGADGIFEKTIALDTGKHLFVLVAYDQRGNAAYDTLRIERAPDTTTPTVRDTTAPSVEILSPKEGTSVPNDSTSILVEVSASDASGIESIKIGATLLKSAPWKARSDLAVGSNEIVVVALDSAGNTDTARVKVVRAARGDHTPPTIQRLTPTSDTVVPWSTTAVAVRWNIQDDSTLARVTLDGTALTGADGLFERTIALDTGKHVYVLVATDLRGNTSRDTLRIERRRDSEPPRVSRVLPLQDTLLPSSRDTLSVTWKVQDNDSLKTVSIQGKPISPNQGTYQAKIPLSGDSIVVRLQATDRTGNVTTDSIQVVRIAPPTISPTSRGLKSAQIVTFGHSLPSLVEYSIDGGTTWKAAPSEIEVSTNTRVLARVRKGTFTSEISRADYAFAPSFKNAGAVFLGADTAWLDDRGTDSVTYSLDGTRWSRWNKFLVLDRSTTLQTRSHVGSAISPVATADFTVHTAEVIAGFFSTFLLLDDHTVWAAGRNEHGRDPAGKWGIFGDGHTETMESLHQIQSNIQRVAPGNHFALYQNTRGSTSGSGFNGEGQLGLENQKGTSVLEPIMDGMPYAGALHSAFVSSAGIMYATGYNSDGQLGDGTNTNRKAPVPIMEDVESVAASTHHTAILMKDHSLWGTGSNADGRLGLGESVDGTKTPQKILEGVQAVAVGDDFTIALLLDGTVSVMGSNEFGQLGDGTFKTRFTPTNVPGLSGIQAIAAGTNHSLFLTGSGDLLGCGNNDRGQLGRSSTAPFGTPVVVATDITQFSAHTFVSLFSKKDGSVWGTGANTFGGISPISVGGDISTPVRIRLPSSTTGN